MNLETQTKAAEALAFLRGHPALDNEGGDSLFNGSWFHMELCCKRGKSTWAGIDGVDIWKRDPNWVKYKDYFDVDPDDGLPEELHSAKVPYEVVYGEPWKADHMEYWYEICFVAFEGDPYDSKAVYDYAKWARYGGPEGGANSFEEMLIQAAAAVKDAFGDFNSYDSFMTVSEVRNHTVVVPMSFAPIQDKPGYSTCVFNDQYVDNGQGLTNLRWLQWFITTDYAKKNWESSLQGWQVLIDKITALEPEKRKQMLAASNLLSASTASVEEGHDNA